MTFNQQAHLAHLHQERRSATLSKIDNALNYLMATKQPINFSSVAKQAKISRSTLYSMRNVKDKISRLRNESINEISISTKESAKKAQLIQSLRRKVATLEQENQELKQQVKILYGQVYEQNQQE